MTVKAAGDQDVLAEVLEREVEGVTRTRQTERRARAARQGSGAARCRGSSRRPRAAGSRSVDLSVAEPSLETVFINLTGKELRD